MSYFHRETWNFRRPNKHAIEDIEGLVARISITNIADYETRFRKHRGCYGHISVTPTGVKLVPGSLAKRTTENRNLFNEARKAALERTGKYVAIRYQDFIRGIMLGKRGHIRGSILSSPIEGSAYARDSTVLGAELSRGVCTSKSRKEL